MSGNENSLRVAVLGAGAVGTLVAARLAASGQPVTVVARGERLAHIKANGLQLRDVDGKVENTTVDARAAGEVEAQDIVLLALKGKAIPKALPDLMPLIGPRTLVVPLVNGIPWWYRQPKSRTPVSAVDPEGALAAAVKPHQIAGAVLFLTSSVSSDGVVDVQGAERIVFGPVVENNMASLDPLRRIFANTAIETKFVADVRRDLWSKVALNLATNPLSVITASTLERQFRSSALAAVVRSVLEETVAVARALDVQPRLDVERMIEIGGKAGAFYTSMAQDHFRGLPLELGAICESVFELADEVAVKMPVSRTVYELCRYVAGCNKAGATSSRSHFATQRIETTPPCLV